MNKIIKTLSVSDDTFHTDNGDFHHVNVEFEDGYKAYANCVDNPPWYIIGGEVAVIPKGSKTKGDNPVDKVQIKKVEEGSSRGGGGSKNYVGGSKGVNESFALSYAKDVACALIKAGVITDPDTAFTVVEGGFNKLLPLLTPIASTSPKTPAEDPLMVLIKTAADSHGLCDMLKGLAWKTSELKTRWNSVGGNSRAFADLVRQEASGGSQLPEDDDVPFN